MYAPCRTHIPFRHVPAHVIFSRDGRRLHRSRQRGRTHAGGRRVATTHPGLYLQAGDDVSVLGSTVFTLRIDGNRYRVRDGAMRLECRPERIGTTAQDPATHSLLLDLTAGTIHVTAGTHTRRAAVVTPEMLAFATSSGTNFSVTRNRRARATFATTHAHTIVTARARDESMRVVLQPTYTAISDRLGIRLNVWPFPLSRLQRPVRANDDLPEYWADGAPCATGCGGGYVHGWPLKPFHRQHAIRAGIDELRTANLHVAVDVQANNFQPVYAIESGVATVAATGSYGDTKITVGRFTYWHVAPTVATGEWVTAYQTMLGRVEYGQHHMAFEEGGDNDYLNPLRPGGPLSPYTDTVAPIIGRPEIYPGGQVIVPAFDPQSFVHRQSYLTPVLALAGLAWRLYDDHGRPLTGLQWALRASGYLSPGLKPVIFAPGASNPGYACFFSQFICKPNWVYNLAGGLTGPLPIASLPRGRYRLTVYAEDFKGNASALDDWFTVPLSASEEHGLQPLTGPLDAQYDP